MINYTERLSLLMQDVVTRVEALSFINMADVLVFARQGRTTAEGAFATCHCLTLPPSELVYYFWRDRDTGLVTRRSEWFVTKSPSVSIQLPGLPVYTTLFAPPRFSDQTIGRSRKERFDPGKAHAWDGEAGKYGRPRALSHRSESVRHPAPRPRRRHLFHELPQPALLRTGRRDGVGVPRHASRSVGVRFSSGTTSPTLESRFHGRGRHHRSGRSRRTRSASSSACRTSRCARSTWTASRSSRSRSVQLQKVFTEDDLHVRHFMRAQSKRVIRKGQYRAA